ncbi:MAG: hypothetical protein ACP5RS_03290 [Thermoplasmata archaeon]
MDKEEAYDETNVPVKEQCIYFIKLDVKYIDKFNRSYKEMKKNYGEVRKITNYLRHPLIDSIGLPAKNRLSLCYRTHEKAYKMGQKFHCGLLLKYATTPEELCENCMFGKRYTPKRQGFKKEVYSKEERSSKVFG